MHARKRMATSFNQAKTQWVLVGPLGVWQRAPTPRRRGGYTSKATRRVAGLASERRSDTGTSGGGHGAVHYGRGSLGKGKSTRGAVADERLSGTARKRPGNDGRNRGHLALATRGGDRTPMLADVEESGRNSHGSGASRWRTPGSGNRAWGDTARNTWESSSRCVPLIPERFSFRNEQSPAPRLLLCCNSLLLPPPVFQDGDGVQRAVIDLLVIQREMVLARDLHEDR